MITPITRVSPRPCHQVDSKSYTLVQFWLLRIAQAILKVRGLAKVTSAMCSVCVWWQCCPSYGLKLRLCKSWVWPQSIGGVDAFSQLTCSEECGKLSMGIWDWFARHALNAKQNEMHVSAMRWMEGFNQAACRLKRKSLCSPGRPFKFSPTRLKSLDATRKVQTGMWTSEGQELYRSGRLVFREMFRIDTR